jgi:hypothetical protein
MTGRRVRAIGGWAMAIAMVLTALVAAPAGAGKDRSAPTAPTNLRVTGMTPYSISLAWSASKDSSGIASYTICCTNSNSMTVSGTTTAFTYTKGVESGSSFSLFVVARDTAGNGSKMSNVVTGTTPRDLVPPTKPVVTVTNVGPTSVSLAFSTVEEGPVWWSVAMDGATLVNGSRESTATFGLLEPESTHTFRVTARDFGGNTSVSDPVTVTTEARDTTDTAAPTPVTDVFPFIQEPDGETWLHFTESTDDTTPQDLIVYDVYLNGEFSHSIMGFNRMIEYGVPMSFNTWTIIAVDESGNESEPVSITTNNTGSFG